jgi:anti-sigma regulatory factor (Ser/Thr protein kinase)
VREIALHVLDIARNSVEAGANRLLITILEDEKADLLTVELVDNGRGMDDEQLRRAADPFYTTRHTRRFGLGLSLFKTTCEQSGGDLTVKSMSGTGTHVIARMKLSHVDRPPVGDMGGVMQSLACEADRVHLTYRHGIGGRWLSVDTNALQYELDDIGLRSPLALQWLRKHVEDGLRDLRRRTRTRLSMA